MCCLNVCVCVCVYGCTKYACTQHQQIVSDLTLHIAPLASHLVSLFLRNSNAYSKDFDVKVISVRTTLHLHYTLLHYTTTLPYTTLHYTMLRYTLHYTTLHDTILNHTTPTPYHTTLARSFAHIYVHIYIRHAHT